MLIGRTAERQVVDSLVAGARTGRSGVLLITGEAGIGKTALLEYAAIAAHGMRVDRVIGTELERDLGFGGLSQLVGSSIDEVDLLPEPQAQALSVALDLRPGPPAPRFAVGAATLGLLARRAEGQPLAVLVDDAHLLDHLSAAALAFAARRLVADPILVLATLRSGEPSALLQAGLPVLELQGLDAPSATRLLRSNAHSVMAGADIQALLHATGGNPLALLELGAHPERIRAVGPDGPLPVPTAITRAFQARTERLSASARTALLVAAAGGTDRRLVSRASRLLGVDAVHLVEAADVGLLTMDGALIAFRHPLVRAAVYTAARPADRRAAHAALAEACENDPDSRAWHLAAAAPDTDDVAATALEQVAERATVRAAYDIVSSALGRAAWLSTQEQDRSRRLVSAAEAAWIAGQADGARGLLAEIDVVGSAALLARAGRLRGTLAALSGSLAEALEVLGHTAEQVREASPGAAAELWSDGVKAAFFAADTAFLRRAVVALEELLPSVRSSQTAVVTELAIGMARTLTGQGGSDQIRRSVEALSKSDLMRADPLHADWLVLGPLYLREEGQYRALVHEALQDTRTGVALGALGHLLFHVALDDAAGEHWSRAESEYHESIALSRESGHSTDVALGLAGLAWLEARMGRADRCREHAEESLRLCDEHGITIGRVWARLALGELELGGGRADEALEHLEHVRDELSASGLQDMDLDPGVDLVEALVRLGRRHEAVQIAADYHRRSAAKGQPWALARAERTLGMTVPDDAADEHFAAASRLHATTPDVFEAARTELLHGMSLRRRRRRREARVRLRSALTAFERLGAEQRAEQAAAELAATGETVQRRGASIVSTLTPQERQIADLLADGRTTRQAAAALFLSPKTVEYHLRHIYDKLEVNTREGLADVVRSGDADRSG